MAEESLRVSLHFGKIAAFLPSLKAWSRRDMAVTADQVCHLSAGSTAVSIQ